MNMEKWTKHHSIFTKTIIGLIGCFFNPNPHSGFQRFVKLILKHFSYLRHAMINYVILITDLDIYHLQAITILENAGIDNPKKYQISTIEQLLKTK